jgi:hypothetical protein
MRSVSRITAVHLAIPENSFVMSISWNGARSSSGIVGSPTNRIIGVASCCATYTPDTALTTPGPRVAKAMPGCPVSLPVASAIIAAAPS